MPETTIAPPTPTVPQGEAPIANDSVQKAFDRVLPEIRGTPKSPVTPPVTPPPTPEPPKAIEEPVPPVEKPQPDAKKDASTVPSFIEEVLTGEPAKPGDKPAPSPEADGEFPEELPAFKTPEERSSRYKQWRSSYQKLKDRVQELEKRPASSLDEATVAKFTAIEQQNKEMSGTLARLGVEQHRDFQNNVIRPLHGAWNEAARIVKEAGGDPNDLARAMGQRGKAHFEALDSLMESFPESAKGELRDAVREYRRVDGVRQKALAEAPKTFQALRQKDMAEQMQLLEKQQQELSSVFDDAVKTLREDGKLEVLLTGDGDEAKDWNANAQTIIERSKNLLFKNTDMKKMAMATLLANSADSYRRLWLQAEARARKAEGTLGDKFSREPVLSSSADLTTPPEAKLKEDLNKPFSAVFLEQLKKQRAG